MKIKLKCKICGKDFLVKPYRKNEAKFCSKECYRKHKSIEMKNKPSNFGTNPYWSNSLKIGLICKVCGKLKKIPLSLYLSGQKTCSLKCRNIAKKKYPLKGNCKHCGKEFKPNPCRNLNFCDRSCYLEYKRKKAERFFVCKYCGKRVKTTHHKNYYDYRSGKKEVKKYCSKPCADMDKKEIRGKEHFNWKGGKTDLQDLIRKSSYSQDYRHEVFKRDGWQSILSGENGRLVHHHLIAFSILLKQYKITKDNWINFKSVLFDLNNAVTLTKKEHKKFHELYGKITISEDFEKFKHERRIQ